MTKPPCCTILSRAEPSGGSAAMRRVRRKAGAERPASPTGSPQGPDPRPGRSRARLNLLPVLALLLGAVSPFAAAPAEAQTGSVDAAYDVTFEGLWNLNSTPGGVAGGAHFTTLIGAVHNGNVTFWAAGGTASSGVEEVAEIGGTSAFKSEYNAVPAAHRKALIEAGGTGATGTSTFTIEASTTHPLVTLLSMIGPSPDWFVGVSGLSLRNSQGWQSRVSMDLFPYDAGTEDGTEFTLSNPATNPQGTITSIKGQGKFSNEPMARLTFVLQTSQPPPPPILLPAILLPAILLPAILLPAILLPTTTRTSRPAPWSRRSGRGRRAGSR